MIRTRCRIRRSISGKRGKASLTLMNGASRDHNLETLMLNIKSNLGMLRDITLRSLDQGKLGRVIIHLLQNQIRVEKFRNLFKQEIRGSKKSDRGCSKKRRRDKESIGKARLRDCKGKN
jgi:hypothetical protein